MENCPTTQEKSPLFASHHHLKSSTFNWPCRATKAKINIVCVDCEFLWVAHWKGVIRGKGLRGSLNAYCTRVKYAYLDSLPLITLYTACIECCREIMSGGKDQIGLTYNYKRTNQEMIVVLRYKEVEDMVSSKVIMMQGAFFDANTIQTIRKDGQWRKWGLWNPRQILKN
jgi:hypothetical protein